MLCFIYTREILDCEKSLDDIGWDITTNTLVKVCVEHLIADLDINKARGLPEAKKKALTQRRSDYKHEKMEFLEYFSVELYKRSQTLFTKDDLDSLVKSFFNRMVKSKKAKEILDLYKNSSSNVCDFSTQLIYSGVFCLSSQKSGENYYDFPHRRFREYFASSYISDARKYIEILSVSHTQNLSELFIVLNKYPI